MLRRLRLSGSFIAALIVITGFVYASRTQGLLAGAFSAPAAALSDAKGQASGAARKIEVTIYAPQTTQADNQPVASGVQTGAQSVVYSVNRPTSAPASITASTPGPTVAPAAQAAVEPTPTLAAVAEQTQAQPQAPAAPEPTALPIAAQLEGIRHQQQSWNNCGPATLSMMLSYFGQDYNQKVIAKDIKPFKDDKNTSPEELISFADSIGYRSRIIQGGDINMLKALIANNFPVIVETWFIPEPDDEMGHYQLLVGYDGDVLRFFDSYHGPNIKHPTEEFDGLWRVFNRLAVVVWPPEQDEQMKAILGPRWEDTSMYQGALATAQAEAAANPQDKFAWFNIGTSLLKLGDGAGAVQAYQTARELKLPWRMLWYQFGPYEANYNQGNYDNLVKITSETLKVKAGLEESYYWRGMARAALGDNNAARQDFQQALQYRENYAQAQAALDSLP